MTKNLGFSLVAGAALVAGLALAPAAHAQPAADVAAGKAAYEARCARCHQVASLMPYLAARPDDAARGARLETFLAKHHARDAGERKAIIAWLLAQQPR